MNKREIITKNQYGSKSGSLPSYIVNVQDIYTILYDIFNSYDIVDYGKQKSMGFTGSLVENEDYIEIKYKINEIAYLLNISYFLDDKRNIGYNSYFDFYINDEKIFEKIYFKEINDEIKNFKIRKTLNKYDFLKFKVYNIDKKNQNIFFNIDYIGDIPIKKYIIKCKNLDTDEIISESDLYLIPPTKQIIYPPTIDGYNTTSEPIEISTSNNISEIIFYYKVVPQEIKHDYDLLIQLWWNSQSDLDISCNIDGNIVSYQNKKYELDENNSMWLDYDYTKPTKDDEPETITILGFKENYANIFLTFYNGIINEEDNIVLKISKNENNVPVLLKEYTHNDFIELQNVKDCINVCEINLNTNEINDILQK